MDEEPFLTVEGLSKSFGPTRALDSVSLAVRRGGIAGLAGENGAGKSTLIKILCGVHKPDSGAMTLDGKPFRPRGPADAERSGVSVFHQEIPICPNLSIAANVFLGPDMPRRGLGPDWKSMRRSCEELYRTLLGEEIDPRRLLRDCTAAEQQLALLVRVLSRNARLVVLDEPTTALTPPEVERLFGIVRRLAGRGISFVFVSHMLEELSELSDEITVLRDGRNVGRMARGSIEVGALAELIAGRSLSGRGKAGGARSGEPVLEARALGLPGSFAEVSFALRPGEILGIAGLQGSGRGALARALFGAPPARSGEILVGGRRVRVDGPTAAMRAGIGYLPEDRKALGICADLDVKANLCLAGLDRFSPGIALSNRALRSVSGEMGERLSIKMRDVDAPISSLSGGNQQKVLLGRWLALKPRVLVMSEPTRGVDVGAKAEITAIVRALAEEGFSFVIASSEMEELLELSDRIIVMNRGRVAGEFAAAEATKDRLILAATA